MLTYKPDRLPNGFLRQWILGQPFDPPPPIPVKVTIEPGEGGRVDDYYDSKIYLMTKQLADFFSAVGVDNLDTYPCEILDVETQNVMTTHVAFNVVGRVAAANLQKSRFTDIDGLKMFDSMSIDEARARGLLLFRLHEAPSRILVHQSIKMRAEAKGIQSLMFLDPEQLSA